MAERFSNLCVAYTKGVEAFRKSGTRRKAPRASCPYGPTKVMMADWWHTGHRDAQLGIIDYNFYKEKDNGQEKVKQ